MIFPVLFIIELILGFSGKTILIAGVGIRYYLFILSAICLYIYFFQYILKSKIKLLSFSDFKNSYIGQFKLLDWVIVAFLLSSVFSAVVIPVLFGGALSYSFDDAKSILLFLLYFPVSFLIKKKQICSRSIDMIIYNSCTALSALHIFFYFGLLYDTNFIYNFFNILNKILLNSGEIPEIILGHNQTPRVIFTTCTFLLVGIYVFLKKENKKLYDYCYLFLNITAIMTTMTKSIWFGIIIGTIILFSYLCILFLKQNDIKNLIKLNYTLACILIFCVVLNSTMFDNMVYSRIAASFMTSASVSDSSDTDSGGSLSGDMYDEQTNIDNDIEASIISNDIKIEQTQKLMGKWRQHPILGNGYGSYVKDCIRSSEKIYSYEVQAPALLMKIGILGLMFWGLLFFSMFITKLKSSKHSTRKLFFWLFLLISFGLAVQTNPMLFSFTGMAIMVYLCLETSH